MKKFRIAINNYIALPVFKIKSNSTLIYILINLKNKDGFQN